MSRIRGTRAATLALAAAAVAALCVACVSLSGLDSGTPDGDAGALDASVSQEADHSAVPTDGAPARDAPSPVICPLYVPPEGVYAYSTVSPAVLGRETTLLLDAGVELQPPVSDYAIGPSLAATVRHTATGGFDFRLDLNANHWNQYSFASSSNGNLVVPKLVEVLRVGFTVPIAVDCVPPVDVIRCPMVLDASWAGACTGLFNDGGKFDAKLSYVFPDVYDWAVGGVLVPTYHVVETRSLSGALAGSEENEYWFAVKDGLLVHAKLKAGDPGGTALDGLTFSFFGAREYKLNVELKLDSLTPAPLPPPPDAN